MVLIRNISKRFELGFQRIHDAVLFRCGHTKGLQIDFHDNPTKLPDADLTLEAASRQGRAGMIPDMVLTGLERQN